jgi:hypothetical protein
LWNPIQLCWETEAIACLHGTSFFLLHRIRISIKSSIWIFWEKFNINKHIHSKNYCVTLHTKLTQSLSEFHTEICVTIHSSPSIIGWERDYHCFKIFQLTFSTHSKNSRITFLTQILCDLLIHISFTQFVWKSKGFRVINDDKCSLIIKSQELHEILVVVSSFW